MTEKYQLHRGAYELLKGAEDPTMKNIAQWLGGVLSAVDEGKPVVYNQFTFWCDTMVPMGLQPLAPELWGLLPGAATSFPALDAAHDLGIPSEMCWAGRYVIGATLLDQLPPPSMMALPSYPCDNCKAAYQVIAELTGAPLYLVDCPYWVEDDEESMDYWVNQYKGLISFMEEHSGKKLDYDRLKEVAEESNRYIEYWLEGKELMRLKPLPQNGPWGSPAEILTTFGSPSATAAIKARLDALKARVANGETAVPEEKVRVVWNYLPVLWSPALFNWMAEMGAVIALAIYDWTSFEPIDTSTPESTIRGMAKRALHGYMARQGRGSSDIIIEDTLNAFEEYQADCIIVNGAFGCKWLRGSYGYLSDLCRERGIPVMMFDADIGDSRVVSDEEVKARVGEFLETVMERKKGGA
ncbi:hypothetical protein ES703_04686 [subsurface metagenome]